MKRHGVSQNTKQSTTVNVNNNYSCNRKRICNKKNSHVRKVSGRIYQLCNSEPKVYFMSIHNRPSALIQIENKSDCLMRAIININQKKKSILNIEREQQISVSVPSIMNLKIHCIGENTQFCRGFYSLCLF